MAKFGEGDARWIVEERADGTNVNNWHWSEKDLTPVVRQQVKAALEGLELLAGEDGLWAKVDELDAMEGESTGFNRKGTLKYLLDVEPRVKWTCSVRDGDGNELQKGRGTITVTEFTQDDDVEDIELAVKAFGESAEELRMKAALQRSKEAKSKIVAKLRGVKEYMVANFTGSVDDKKGGPPTAGKDKPALNQVAVEPVKAPEKPKRVEKKGMRTVDFKTNFRVSPKDLFELLTDPQRIMAVTNAPAQVTPASGAPMMMFGGSVQGENLEMIPGSQIMQKWRFADWPAGHFSTLTITIKPGSKDGVTTAHLVQTDVPEDAYERVLHGWKQIIFLRMAKLFAIGM